MTVVDQGSMVPLHEEQDVAGLRAMVYSQLKQMLYILKLFRDGLAKTFSGMA